MKQRKKTILKYLRCLGRTVVQFLGRVFRLLLRGMYELLAFLLGSVRGKSPYTGAFMSDSERRKLLHKKHRGFVLGMPHRRLSLAHSYTNIMVYGGVGSGKSAGVIVPTLLHLDTSAVCFDVGNTLYQKTSGYLSSRGFRVVRINLDDARESARYNPLMRCKSMADRKKLSHSLISTGLQGGAQTDPFWVQSAEQMLFVLLEALMSISPSGFHNLANLRHLLIHLSSSTHSRTADWVLQNGSEELFAEWKSAFAGSAQKTIDSSLMTVKACLQKIADPTIAALTAEDTLGDLNALLRQQKTVLYISVQESTLSYNAFLLSLLLSDIFAALQQSPERNDSPVLLLLDEIGHVFCPTLPTAISTLRKRNVGMCLCVQSRKQLEHLYGAARAETIMNGGCATHLYLPGQTDFRQNTELSRLLGLRQVSDEQGRSIARPLIAIDELLTDKKRSLLIQGGMRPLRFAMVPYFKQKRVRQKTTLPEVSMPSATVTDIPKVPLPHLTS